MNIRSLLETAAPVMPVLTIQRVEDAVPLADALAAGGLRVLEITLRTDAAIDAISAIRETRPTLVVGAGTVLTPKQMGAVSTAGGQFAVSPGLTATLVEAAEECEMPYLPGVVTAGEIQHAMEAGLDALKFFPAAAAGGPGLLKNYASVFPQAIFCPTGGIRLDNMRDYLGLKNVGCVGGSWIAPRQLVDDGDWAAIERLARQATA